MNAGASAPDSRTRKGGDRFAVLDGLCALAILAVLPHNLSLISEPHTAATRLWVQMIDRGWIGLQLIFVLAGYGITSVLLDTGHSHFDYYGRLARRWLPAYWVALLIWLVLLPALGLTAAREPRYDFAYWLLVCNWLQPYIPIGAGVSHLWAVAVVAQFALMWPLILRRHRSTRALQLCLAVAALALTSRLLLLSTIANQEAAVQWTICRVDALAFGGAVAVILKDADLNAAFQKRKDMLARITTMLFVFGATISRGYAPAAAGSHILGQTLLAGAFSAGFLTLAQQNKPVSLLNNRALQDLGRWSYAIYLVHYPFAYFVEHRLYPSGMPRSLPFATDATYVAGMLVASVLLGALVHKAFEQLTLREQL